MIGLFSMLGNITFGPFVEDEPEEGDADEDNDAVEGSSEVSTGETIKVPPRIPFIELSSLKYVESSKKV